MFIHNPEYGIVADCTADSPTPTVRFNRTALPDEFFASPVQPDRPVGTGDPRVRPRHRPEGHGARPQVGPGHRRSRRPNRPPPLRPTVLNPKPVPQTTKGPTAYRTPPPGRSPSVRRAAPRRRGQPTWLNPCRRLRAKKGQTGRGRFGQPPNSDPRTPGTTRICGAFSNRLKWTNRQQEHTDDHHQLPRRLPPGHSGKTPSGVTPSAPRSWATSSCSYPSGLTLSSSNRLLSTSASRAPSNASRPSSSSRYSSTNGSKPEWNASKTDVTELRTDVAELRTTVASQTGRIDNALGYNYQSRVERNIPSIAGQYLQLRKHNRPARALATPAPRARRAHGPSPGRHPYHPRPKG